MRLILTKHLSRTSSIFLALLVTFLWSTSFIIIKLGLNELPPLTFAGLRYILAFFFLLPFAFTKSRLEEIRNIDRIGWIKLTALGFLFYTFTQGTLFIGLSLLPVVSVSLILNFTPLVVALMGIFFLLEKPTRIQWLGALLFILGIIVYFYPVELSSNQTLGIVVMLIGVITNSSSAILGRAVNRSGKFSPLVVTAISMGIGSMVLLIVGLAIQGMPPISLRNFLFLLWLAVINTAFAFTLWNLTLQKLTAMESSIINGTILIQVAALAWFFIDEPISLKEGIGMLAAAIGALLVQIKK